MRLIVRVVVVGWRGSIVDVLTKHCVVVVWLIVAVGVIVVTVQVDDVIGRNGPGGRRMRRPIVSVQLRTARTGEIAQSARVVFGFLVEQLDELVLLRLQVRLRLDGQR